MSFADKACPVMFRDSSMRKILAFEHPEAGVQLVKGSIEPGENPRLAALRELAEEAEEYAEEGMVQAMRELPELRDAMSLVWRILLLWLAVLAVLAMIALTLVVGIVGGILALVGGLVHKALGMLLVAPVYLGMLLVVYVVMFGTMYFMWRDVCGEAPAADAPRDDHIEL